MNANAVLLDREFSAIGIELCEAAGSSAASGLLLRAITWMERDEAVATDLVKKALTVLETPAPGECAFGEKAVSGGLAPWQVSRLKTHIDARIAYSISLEELARLVKLSTSHFSAAFKVSFGTSPHNYVLSRRVDHAKTRMLSSDAPLCEIALDCGLADQAHLSRVFRRMTGTTPSMWRREQFLPEDAASAA